MALAVQACLLRMTVYYDLVTSNPMDRIISLIRSERTRTRGGVMYLFMLLEYTVSQQLSSRKNITTSLDNHVQET